MFKLILHTYYYIPLDKVYFGLSNLEPELTCFHQALCFLVLNEILACLDIDMISNDEFESSTLSALNLGQPRQINLQNIKFFKYSCTVFFLKFTVRVANCFPPVVLKIPI